MLKLTELLFGVKFSVVNCRLIVAKLCLELLVGVNGYHGVFGALFHLENWGQTDAGRAWG